MRKYLTTFSLFVRESYRTTLTRSYAHFGGDRSEGGTLRSKARASLEKLEAACEPLAELAGEVEERFLACGRALQDQVKLTSALAQQGQKLRDFSGRIERGETALCKVRALISEHLRLGDDFAKEVGRLGDSLEHHAGHLKVLIGEQAQIERSFAPMKVLHAFFRIESATLPVELQSLFQAVTVEMERLHADANASFIEQVTNLTETRSRVLATAAKLHSQSSEHVGVIRGKRADVQKSVGRLEKELEQARKRDQALEEALAQINARIDAMTVGLQFQDITRQKMDHVQTAAKEIFLQISDSQNGEFEKRLRSQRVLCEVQASQLDSVQTDLQRATSTMTAGLSALIDQLEKIEQTALSLTSLQQITADMDAVVDETAKTHRITADLMRTSLESLTAAIASARGFAEATTGATGAMRRLASEIHLIGLNAQIQAVQAKNGSLEVLSSATSAISHEAAALSQVFEDKLVNATGELNRFVQESEGFHEKMRDEYAALIEKDGMLFGDLEKEQALSKTALRETETLLRRLKSQADALLSSLDLAEFSREALKQTRALFGELSVLGSEMKTTEGPGDTTDLGEIENRYTMSSERAAHAAVVAAQTSSSSLSVEINDTTGASSGELSPTAAPPAEVLSDNVELF